MWPFGPNIRRMEEGRDLAGLIAVMGKWGHKRALDARLALVRLGQEAVEGLCAGLGSPSAHARHECAEVLGKIRDPRAVGALAGALGDTLEVRRAAVRSLAMIGGSQTVLPLCAALADPDESVRIYAAEGLERHGDERAVEALSAASEDARESVRRAVVQALAKLRSPKAVPALCARAMDGGYLVASYAIGGLMEIGDRAAVGPLCRALLGNSQWDARSCAAAALGVLRAPEAIQPLRESLRDARRLVRQEAALALLMLGDHSGLEEVRWAMHYAEDAAEVERLVVLLAGCADAHVRRFLEVSATSEDEAVARLAAVALAMLARVEPGQAEQGT